MYFTWGEYMKNRIHELRNLLNISQEALADAVNVTRQTIISLEKDRYTASLVLAHKLSKYFGVSIEYLFDLESKGED